MEHKHNNKLFLITGVSGSGKTTVMQEVLDNEIVSITTRDKRKGEVDGVDYYFTTKKLFKDLIDTDSLIEHIEYYNNYYGFSFDEVESKLEEGNAYAIVTHHGYEQLKEVFPNNSVGVYLEISSHDALERMKLRGDKQEDIDDRMSNIDGELSEKKDYKYVIQNTNGQMDRTIDVMKKIIDIESNSSVHINV